MDKLNLNKKVAVLSFLVFYTILSNIAYGAIVIFTPSGGNYRVGDTINLDVNIDTQGESINAVDLEILYPKIFGVRSIKKSNSAIQLWINNPSYTNDTVFFQGGIIGGINKSKVLIGQIIFEAKAIGLGSFGLSPASKIVLNNGEGTPASLSVNGGIFEINPSDGNILSPITEEKIDDKTKPAKFKIYIDEDPRVFEGKKFASFFTSDNESGVSRYEIKEGNGIFKVAESPYLLANQELQNVIRIRAYDAGGNYREAIYPNIWTRFIWQLQLFFKILVEFLRWIT